MPKKADPPRIVQICGRIYHLDRPPSEQQVVQSITRRLQSFDERVKQRQDLGQSTLDRIEPLFTEEEFRAFATAYPRLYYVPGKTGGRLEAWIQRREGLVRSWALDGFLNTKAHDYGRDVRRPGVPKSAEEVKALAPRPAVAAPTEAADQFTPGHLGSGSAGREKNDNEARVESNRPGTGSDRSVAGELEEALRSAQRRGASLTELHDKTQMPKLAELVTEMTAHTEALERALESTYNLSRQLGQPNASLSTRSPKRKLSDESGDQDEESTIPCKTRRFDKSSKTRTSRGTHPTGTRRGDSENAVPWDGAGCQYGEGILAWLITERTAHTEALKRTFEATQNLSSQLDANTEALKRVLESTQSLSQLDQPSTSLSARKRKFPHETDRAGCPRVGTDQEGRKRRTPLPNARPRFPSRSEDDT
ncbi:hypothetical protein VTJ49DRAFT_7451 [Mycothermus thermophilus]|uniref:Uncharacterized protein n=1 Tax=Humicola insolens TaxID=85995 RepID=A0ABR3VHQ6_HUMIN